MGSGALPFAKGGVHKTQFQDLRKCSMLTIKAFINEFQIGKDSFSPIIHLPF